MPDLGSTLTMSTANVLRHSREYIILTRMPMTFVEACFVQFVNTISKMY